MKALSGSDLMFCSRLSRRSIAVCGTFFVRAAVLRGKCTAKANTAGIAATSRMNENRDLPFIAWSPRILLRILDRKS